MHGLVVDQALIYIFKSINLALDHSDYVLEIMHGFNRGSAIQRRILKLSSEDHPSIVRVRSHILNPGVSIIDLKVDFD